MPTETIITLIVSSLAALGLGGIIGVLIQRRFEQQKQSNEHDIKIFVQSNDLLNEEKLSFIVGHRLWSNHSISDDNFYILTNWCIYFQQIGNSYLDNKIDKENRRLLEDLLNLTNFVGLNFFTIIGQNPNNREQYLKPDWNPDRGDFPSPEKIVLYKEYVKELENLIERALSQYKKYRIVVKHRLKI